MSRTTLLATTAHALLLVSLLVVMVHHAAIVEGNYEAETMYRVISGFLHKHPSWRSNASLDTWAGVSGCPGANCTFKCRNLGGFGTLDLSSLESFNYFAMLSFAGCDLSGTVNLAELPVRLDRMYLGGNRFSGTVDLTQLPASLQRLQLWRNSFSGSVDLGRLPPSLQWLYLGLNNFSGSVDLRRLPSGVKYINLVRNHFSGSVDLSSLPHSLLSLLISDNQFSGSVILTGLPKGMRYLDIANNAFTGVIDKHGVPASLEVVASAKKTSSEVGESTGGAVPTQKPHARASTKDDNFGLAIGGAVGLTLLGLIAFAAWRFRSRGLRRRRRDRFVV